MGKIIKDGVEYDFGSDIIYHLVGSGDSGGSSEGDSESSSGIKVVELGALGETFDLTQYEGYENFTLDNFYVQIDSASSEAGTTGINYWTDTHGRTAYFANSQITGGSASLSELLSYDASTGQLTTKKTDSGSVTMQAVNYNDSYDKKSAYASLSLTVEGTVYLIQATESDGDSNNSTSELVDGNISLVYSKTSQSAISYTITETGTYTIIATGSQTWLSEDHVTITGFEADTTTTFTNDGSGPHCSKIAHNVQLNEGDVIGVSGCTNNSLLVYKAEVPVGSEESTNGIGGNANTVLLWSQPANGDGTKFNAQTLSLPEIANYEGVAIKCCLCNNSSNGYVNEVMTYYFKKGTSMRVGMRKSSDDVSMATVYRVIEVTEDSVIFNDAYATNTADGRYIYPMEIYGYTTAEIGGSGELDGDVVLGEITEILASGVSNTYTILEDGLYHITSFQGGTYFPIYINDVNQGETVGVNGVVSKTIADGASPVITSLSYLLNLNEGDVVSTTNVNATLAISKIESNVADGENTGNVVEEEKVLLWENTKPTSSFAAQTVTLSQSIEDFDWVEILVYQSTSLKTKPAVYRYQVEQLMDETFHMNLTNKAAFGFVNRCNSSGHFYSRAIGVTSSTGLFFTAALRRDKNTAFEETTAQLIPYQIYGVKNGVIIEEIVNNKANIPTKLLKTVTSSAKNGDNTYTITKDEIGNNDTILMVSSIYTRNGSSSTGAANDITGVTNASYTVISDTHYAVVAKLYDIKGDVTVTVKHNMADVHEQNSVMFYGYDVTDGIVESSQEMLLISCFDGGANTSQMSSAPFNVVKFTGNEITTQNYGYLVNTPTTLYDVVSVQYTYTNGWVLTALTDVTYYDGQSESENVLAKDETISWSWNTKRDLVFYLGETEGSGGSAGGNTTPTVQLPSGVTLTSNAKYRGNTSCSTYFIKGTEQAIFSTSCVNEEEKYKGQLASATSTITIKNASGTTIHTQNITTNTNTTFTFDWDAYGCDIIFVTLSIADAQVTYYTNSVSIATV